jgi:hypothetical protein
MKKFSLIKKNLIRLIGFVYKSLFKPYLNKALPKLLLGTKQKTYKEVALKRFEFGYIILK